MRGNREIAMKPSDEAVLTDVPNLLIWSKRRLSAKVRVWAMTI